MQVSERNVLPVRSTIGRSTLAGAAAGREAAAKLQAGAATLEHPWVLDFADMELVTASAFREAVLPIIRWAAQDGQPCLVANLDEVSQEEALLAASASEVVLLFCSLNAGNIAGAYAQGPLDAKLFLTLELTLRLGEADARAISEVSGENTVITAWNNRLVALTRMGLLTERKVGKTKFYSPAVKGMSYGK